MKQAIIDRIEGQLVVLELAGGEMLTLKQSLFAPGAGEGDVVYYDGHLWQLDKEATAERREDIAALLQEITTQVENNNE